jgi:hypothetical protein
MSGRRLLLAALMTSLGCAAEGSGIVAAEGSWADGAPIQFSAFAQASRTGGRIQVWATSMEDPRFAGLRIAYDPAVVTGPGRYPVDPAPRGSLEIYCARSAPSTSTQSNTVEYEANTATIVIDRLPGPAGNKLAGSFEQVVLERDQPILQLSRGRFEAAVP